MYNSWQREYMRKRRAENRIYLSKVKAMAGCLLCGEKDPLVISFHHLDQSKQKQYISRMVSNSRETINAEIDKCVILCINCNMKVKAGLLEIPEGEYERI